MKNKKLVCFLGNPGKKYSRTRHNLGWIFEEVWSENLTLPWKNKFHGIYCCHENMVLLKPETMMNRSGQSLQAASAFFQIGVKDILVVHDDLELPFGSHKIKSGGGTAGHNGLKSIDQHLKDRSFNRLRLGIGRPSVGSVSSWVLQPFTTQELAELPHILNSAVRSFSDWLKS